MYLIYQYQCGDILFLVMIPYWVLILNTVLATINLTIGLFLLQKKIQLQRAIIINISLMFIGFIIQGWGVMF